MFLRDSEPHPFGGAVGVLLELCGVLVNGLLNYVRVRRHVGPLLVRVGVRR